MEINFHTLITVLISHGLVLKDFNQYLGNFEDVKVDGFANKVHFYLYTREFNNDYELVLNDVESLKNSTFDSSRVTKIAIHGYEHDYRTQPCQLIRQAYMKSSQDVNVICVEWSKLCMGPPHGFYLEAVINTFRVGKLLGKFIDYLVENGNADVSKFHLIGHSLGAHLAAFAANTVTSGNITRISGLDPAGPIFDLFPAAWRLDPSDARVVDVIHTSGGYYALYRPLGTVDFYPNGGKPVQPGCQADNPLIFQVSCSHGAAVRYYASSVLNNFEARSCFSLEELKRADCNGTIGFMGDSADAAPNGIYYLQTTGSWPFTLNVSRVNL